MKSLRVPLLALILASAVPPAFAATLTLTGTIQFSSLDGSADDSDPTPGVFAYNGDLVVDGTINCNDDLPLPDTASACPISIRTTGNLTLDAGSAILAEDRRYTGNGGDVTLDVGGDLTIHGPDGSLPGAIVSSSRPSTAGPHGGDHAGNVLLTVGGTTVIEAGSIVAANAWAAPSGSITLDGQGAVTIGGLLASGPSSNLASTRWTGVVLTGGVNTQGGGPITVTSHSATAGVQITQDGVLVSEGQTPGAGAVRVEGCGIQVSGLVASVAHQNGAAQVVLRSGKDILVSGQDLLSTPPSGATRLGRVRADSAKGGPGYNASLYARGDIQVLGPDPAQSTIFAVGSDPSPNYTSIQGGSVRVVSLAGGLTATGNAFEAGILKNGNRGGSIDLRAQGQVLLDDATLAAIGDYKNNKQHGGSIGVRSYQQGLSWMDGVGDVRPVGTGAPSTAQGTINLTYCTTINTTGTQFPVVGSPIPPFPVVTQTCADAAPSLPNGEPDLPSCSTTAAPIAADDAYTTDQGVALTVPAPGVLANDSGTGLAATAQNAAPTAQGGTVTLNADGSFTYTPPAGFSSPPDDSFTYTVTNGGGSSTATVRITVNADTPPAVQSSTPANGATDVPLTSTVTITFSKPVTVTSSAFSLQCPSGTPIAFTVTPPSPATTFTLQPSANLPGGATCTVTVTASQVTDAANVHPTADFTASFTVDTPPTVTSTVPANGASNVSPSTSVTVNFSKPVTATSAFALQCGNPVAFTVSPASPASSFTLQPSAALPAGAHCTLTISASGVTDAAGTHLAANYTATFDTAIVAHDDLYPETVVGNVPVDSNAIAYSVTANDETGASPVTITAFDATSLHGGSVSMTTSGPGIGRFTYNPPAGYQGADSFHYTITNGTSSATATVNLNVAGMIWFINNNAAAGDGRLTSPFNSLAAFQALNNGTGTNPGANQNIFLYESSADYAGPVTLLSGQKLIGQDATASLSSITGITPGASSAGLPAMNSSNATIAEITSSGNGINLGQNNTVRGLTIKNTSGIGISGNGIGTLTVADATIGNTTGTPVSLTNGNLAVTFKSISANGAPNGIVLNTTTGSFSVTGDGTTAGTGGTIQSTSGAGVSLTNATNVSLAALKIQSTGGSGVKGTQVTNFSFVNGAIDNSGTGGGTDESNISFNDSLTNANVSGTVTITGNTLSNSRYHGIDIQNPAGTVSSANISNNTFTSDTSTANSLGSAIRLIALGSASAVGNFTQATIANNVINNFPSGAGVVIQGGNSADVAGAPSGMMGVPGNSASLISVTGNRMDGGSGGVGNQPDRFITALVNGRGQGNFDISNNGTVAAPIRHIDGVVIELSAFGATTVTATVNNNVIAANNAVASAGIGIGCDADSLTTTTDNASLTTTISGNNVSQTDGPGIYALARNSSCTHVTKILNNTVAAPATSTSARAGIRVDSGSASGNTTVCAKISGNTTAGSTNTGTATTSPGINLRKQGTSTTTNIFSIDGLSPSPASTPAVENYVNGLNTSSSGTFGVGGTALLSATSGFTVCTAT